MKYYPVYLNILDESCVVVGGGGVAERKVARLLESGARVTVVSRTLTERLDGIRRRNGIVHIDDEYRKEHLTGARIVIGATDDPAVNERLFRDCRELGIPVNIVDDPLRCDFILPAVAEQGDLSIAVSTAGKSPLLARRLREELEERYGPEYAVLLKIMGDLRERIIARGGGSGDNREIFEKVLDSPVLEHIRKGSWEEVRRIIRETTGEEIDVGGLTD